MFQCEPISGLGFRRGSYKCVCRIGFYFPDTESATNRFFNGTTLEEEYAKRLEVRQTTSRFINGPPNFLPAENPTGLIELSCPLSCVPCFPEVLYILLTTNDIFKNPYKSQEQLKL